MSETLKGTNTSKEVYKTEGEALAAGLIDPIFYQDGVSPFILFLKDKRHSNSMAVYITRMGNPLDSYLVIGSSDIKEVFMVMRYDRDGLHGFVYDSIP